MIILFGIVLLIAIPISFIVIVFISWSKHKRDTKYRCDDNWGYGNYRTFKREFNRLKDDEWEIRDYDDKLMIDNYHNRVSQASIACVSHVIFKDIGMIISNPVSYVMVQIFIIRYSKRAKKKKRYNWYRPDIAELDSAIEKYNEEVSR